MYTIGPINYGPTQYCEIFSHTNFKYYVRQKGRAVIKRLNTAVVPLLCRYICASHQCRHYGGCRHYSALYEYYNGESHLCLTIAKAL